MTEPRDTDESAALRHFTLSGDAEHVYVSNQAGHIVATLTDEEQARFVLVALNALVSLHGSGVWGLHDDGSMWLQGGAWEKHEHYATADSPLAAFAASLVERASVTARSGS